MVWFKLDYLYFIKQMYSVLLIVAIILLAIQFVLGLSSLHNSHRLHDRFTTPLGSKISVAELLEKYSRVIEPINIKVNSNITKVAVSRGDLLHVNRELVYRTDLFVNASTLWYINLTKRKNHRIMRYQRLQILLFLLELGLLALAVWRFNVLIWGVVVLATVLIISSFLLALEYEGLLEEFYVLGTDLLDLDEVESARFKSFGEELKQESTAYAMIPVVWLVNFLNPFR